MMSFLPTEFLQTLGYALCEDRGGGNFYLLCEPPRWFQEVWGDRAARGEVLALADRSPFLEAFLLEAEDHWNSAAETSLDSGAWIERVSDGREIPLEARAWRVAGKRILCIQSSREEFQKQTRVLQTARDSMLDHERLLKEIQKKEILLHCIIHDLSQPLTAIRGCFDILAHETATPRSKRLIELGRQQSERQDNMIREILQAFTVDMNSAMGPGNSAGGASSILKCAEETVAAFAPVFESHGAAIRLDPRISAPIGSEIAPGVAPGIALVIDRRAQWGVTGDESHLMRIFSNLVENALRHAPKGTFVTIGLEDEGGGYVRAFVDDEGPGLSKEFRPSEAFALFSKGKKGGGKAGLGLYFCRITVERWGGSIGCESLPGRGARFWFRLPRAAVADSPSAPARPSAPVSAESVSRPSMPLTILLAEDDPTIRELTEHLIEREGHEVVCVPSGIEALQAYAQRRFDVILLDEEMPGLGGVEVTKAIRSRESPDGRRQVIFALTGNATDADRARLLDAGFDACFGKPFHADEVLQAAARFALGAAATNAIITMTRTPARKEKESEEEAAPDPSLLARVGGDAKLLRSIASTFLKDYPEKLRKIKRAISRKDESALASNAHALKGAVAIFGASDAVENARNLQQMGREGSLALASRVLGKLDEALARLDTKLREYAPPAGKKSSKPRRTKRAARKPRPRAKRAARKPRPRAKRGPRR